jgi:hypothetical protein
MHHPHLHCVVPGGGISPAGKSWISCRPGFFLSVKVLSRLFRRLFLAQLKQAFDDNKLHFSNSLEALHSRVPYPSRDAFHIKLRPSAAPCPETEPPFESAARPVHWVLHGPVPSFQVFAGWCAGSAQTPGATSAIVRAHAVHLAATALARVCSQL